MKKTILLFAANIYAGAFGFYASDLYSESSKSSLTLKVAVAVGLVVLTAAYIMENKNTARSSSR
jgi:hypothetical protein